MRIAQRGLYLQNYEVRESWREQSKPPTSTFLHMTPLAHRLQDSRGKDPTNSHGAPRFKPRIHPLPTYNLTTFNENCENILFDNLENQGADKIEAHGDIEDEICLVTNCQKRGIGNAYVKNMRTGGGKGR
jgi:hypothetical protein